MTLVFVIFICIWHKIEFSNDLNFTMIMYVSESQVSKTQYYSGCPHQKRRTDFSFNQWSTGLRTRKLILFRSQSRWWAFGFFKKGKADQWEKSECLLSDICELLYFRNYQQIPLFKCLKLILQLINNFPRLFLSMGSTDSTIQNQARGRVAMRTTFFFFFPQKLDPIILQLNSAQHNFQHYWYWLLINQDSFILLEY